MLDRVKRIAQPGFIEPEDERLPGLPGPPAGPGSAIEVLEVQRPRAAPVVVRPGLPGAGEVHDPGIAHHALIGGPVQVASRQERAPGNAGDLIPAWVEL